MPADFKAKVTKTRSSLLDLPTELRLHIFACIVAPALIPRIALSDPDKRHPWVMDFIEAADSIRILRCLRATCKTIRHETPALRERVLDARRDGQTYLHVLPQRYFEMDLGSLLSFSSTFDDAWRVVMDESRT